MPELHESELKQQLKSGEFSHAYLLYGTEGYLKQFYAERIAKKCVTPGMEGFNYKKFDAGDGVGLSEILEAAETLPAFGGSMCILVRDFPLDSLSEPDKKQFTAFMEDLPESLVLIFWEDTLEINPKKNAKWRSVITLFNKYGVSVALDRLDTASLCKLLQSGAKKRGCELTRSEAELLLQTVGNDLNLLLGELEKLCNYKQSGEIQKADIEAVATKSLEANVFDLSKALVAGNCARALALLQKLLSEKERPEMILGTLISAYVDMYRVKLALVAGEKAEYPAQFFNYKGREFRLRNAARDANTLSVEELRRCLDLLGTADRALKSGTSDEKTVLERLLVQLSGVRARR